MAVGLQHASQASDSFEREFTPVWLIAITSAVAVMGLIALAFVLIDFGTARDGLGYVATGIGWVFAGIIALLAWPVIKLFEGIFWLFDFIVGGLQARDEPPPEALPASDEVGSQEGKGSVLPGWVHHLVRYSMASIIFVTIAVALALLFQRFQKRPDSGDNKESVYTEGRLAADLGNLIGSLFHRRGGRVVRANEPVRRLYFEMLAAAESRGVQRRPTDTPLDLSPRIESTFRSQTPREITGLFDDVRYGALEADEEEVRRLRTQWEGLQGT
jgi:hypothetical protein